MKIDFKEENTSRNFIPQSSAVSERPGANAMATLPPAKPSQGGTVLRDKTARLFVLVRRALGIFPRRMSRCLLQAGTHLLLTKHGEHSENSLRK